LDDLNRFYPRYPSIYEINIDLEYSEKVINLEHFMDVAPYTAINTMTLEQAFTIVRGIGIRDSVTKNWQKILQFFAVLDSGQGLNVFHIILDHHETL